jgi:glycosyltransferase involved in cell wall biosynthesis
MRDALNGVHEARRRGGFISHHDVRPEAADLLVEKGARRVAVVVPCYNEAGKIEDTVNAVPDFVDRVYVVDDASTDGSAEIIARLEEADPRVTAIKHEANKGVGAAIATGYMRCLEDGIDIAVVMAGDGQMDPADLPAVILPVLRGEADYVKGNRFFHRTGTSHIPRHRLFGNLALSILTKIVSGYWHVSDTQCGYTAINRRALGLIDWRSVYPRYGCPNDFLTRLNVANMRVAEVPVHGHYGADWSSKMKAWKVVLPILRLLARLFVYRLFYKYVFLNGHPIVIFYLTSALFALLTFLLFIYVAVKFAFTGVIPQASLIMFGISLISTIQLLLGAFNLDYQANQSISVLLSDRYFGED